MFQWLSCFCRYRQRGVSYRKQKDKLSFTKAAVVQKSLLWTGEQLRKVVPVRRKVQMWLHKKQKTWDYGWLQKNLQDLRQMPKHLGANNFFPHKGGERGRKTQSRYIYTKLQKKIIILPWWQYAFAVPMTFVANQLRVDVETLIDFRSLKQTFLTVYHKKYQFPNSFN